MGVDYSTAKKMVQLFARHPGRGRVLMLGRHRFNVPERFRAALNETLAEHGFALTHDDLVQEDGYAETFFMRMGHQEVVTLDISDFEGATILHDLNAPVPEELHGRFDLIYDGGTTEPVFDVATSFSNIHRMLAPGGILVSAPPGNGWFGHGFYQFGPELVYGYWKHGCGYDVLTCSMLPVLPRHKELPLPDPAEKGQRLRLRGKIPGQRVYLYYEVRRGARAHDYRQVLQTDYVNKWSRHDQAAGRSDSEHVRLREEHVTNL
jgi:SAM-dependent methyltransferase